MPIVAHKASMQQQWENVAKVLWGRRREKGEPQIQPPPPPPYGGPFNASFLPSFFRGSPPTAPNRRKWMGQFQEILSLFPPSYFLSFGGGAEARNAIQTGLLPLLLSRTLPLLFQYFSLSLGNRHHSKEVAPSPPPSSSSNCLRLTPSINFALFFFPTPAKSLEAPSLSLPPSFVFLSCS